MDQYSPGRQHAMEEALPSNPQLCKLPISCLFGGLSSRRSSSQNAPPAPSSRSAGLQFAGDTGQGMRTTPICPGLDAKPRKLKTTYGTGKPHPSLPSPRPPF